MRTVLLASLIATCGCNLIAADGPETKEPQKKVEFQPDVEVKFSEFFAKLAEAKRKSWTDVNKAEIEQVSKTTQLSPDGAKALELAGQKAIDACIPDWMRRAEEGWRKNYSRMQGSEVSRSLDQLMARVDQISKSDWFGGFTAPLNHKTWADAVKQTLDANQLSAWEKFSTERRDRFEKEISDFVQLHSPETRGQFTNAYSRRAMNVKRLLSPSKEKAEQLERLAEKVAGDCAAYLEMRMAEGLRNMEESRRSAVIRSGNFRLMLDDEERAKFQAQWAEGLAKILSSDDVIRIKAKRDELKKSRVQVLAALLVLEVDQKVALSSDQRTRFLPIAERLVTGNPSLTKDDDDEEVDSEIVSSRGILTSVSGKQLDELNPILDPLQRRRCEDVFAQKSTSPKVPSAPPKQGNVEQTEPDVEAEVAERQLSEFLHEKLLAERKRALDAVVLKIEDISRVVNLPEASVQRLQTAARGATELSFADWRSGIEMNVRSNLEGVEPKEMKRRLASLQSYQYQRGMEKQPEAQGLWIRTIEKELTPDQLAAWKAEIAERDAFRGKAVAAVLIGEFDRRFSLTSEQREKFNPRVLGIIKDYEGDIRRMFSYSVPTAWYLQRHSMFIPFAGVPEKEMKEILTKEQWEAWSGAVEFGNVTNYWENLERIHQQRMKGN